MKKTLSMLMCLMLILTGIIGCNAESAVNDDLNLLTIVMQIDNPVMTVNGDKREIDPGFGTAPVIENGRTLMPVRAVVEELGGTVIWNEVSQEINLSLGDDVIRLTIGSNSAYFNDEVHILDVAPSIINSRTYMPLRYIAESFDCFVEWNDNLRQLTIFKENAQAFESMADENITADENGMLNIDLKIGSKVFSAKLYDSESSRQLVGQFPLTCDMSELNGNEKFCYLSDNMSVDSQRQGNIQTGDIMLYGPNCLVVFYKSFNSAYSYTRLGYVEDTDGFSEALGTGSVQVTFEMGN